MFTEKDLSRRLGMAVSEQAVGVINYAVTEARSRLQIHVTPEHLFLGLLEFPIPRNFEKFGINPEELRFRAMIGMGYGDRGSDLSFIDFTEGSKMAIYYGVLEAKELDDVELLPEHLWLGVCKEVNNGAARILREHGLFYANMHSAVLQPSGLRR